MYKTKAGDTFESIARTQYGSEQYASLIAKANPGTTEPIPPGVTLAIPQKATDKQGQAASANPNDVAVLINGVRFRFWSTIRITRSLDSMDTIELSAPFDADAPGFREAFRPFSYAPLVVTVGGDALFTGTMIGVTPGLEDRQKTISVSAYSVPGVLNDCTPPASAYPLEFDEHALSSIAKALAEPFGIPVIFSGPSGAVFERVAINPGETVLAFLSDLTKQRALVISSTSSGELLFQRSASIGNPVAVLRQGASPLLGVQPSFSPQEYYSHITGLESVFIGLEGSQQTIKNPHLSGVLRPLIFKAPDTEGANDIEQAVAAKIGRMYGNMASYSVQVNTWRDKSGALWQPNTTLKLQAPDAMVYNPYEFIIRSVSFERDGAKEAAQLDLVLPGSFSGEMPGSLPWD